MQSVFEWLVTLPPNTLYGVLALIAALENFVPPFPSDLTVAFGSFLVAQGSEGTLPAVFLSTWCGNVGGAMCVYFLGRRYGAQPMERRLAGRRAKSVDARLRALFDRFGMAAVFVSRFIPGVRAIVPAFAGALRLPVGRTFAMMALASALWYGLITYVAFRVGADWERLRETLSRYGRGAAIVSGIILVAGLATWYLAHRRRTPT
ncbi:MAG: DedA family protein [Gemmatimonadaceae bacterium]